jgi:hypothetical protein
MLTATATFIDLHRVIVRAPATRTRSGAILGAPPVGSFDPALVRITPVAGIRSGDVVLGTIQPHYDGLCQPLDRAQWVSYFADRPKPQTVGARPFNPAHCDWCTHHAYVLGPAADSSWFTVDGCTLYRPDDLLLVIPRELAPAA